MCDIPNPEDYDVSVKTGFLPSEYPVVTLPDPYYQPWEAVVNNLPSLILTRKIRVVVDKMPILTTQKLASAPEYRRAYQVLGFIAHAYVWGANEATNKLPPQVAEPLLKTADYLRLPPLATYAGLCLWNFKEIMPSNDTFGAEDFDLDNLTTINTYTGSMDESWFYLVSVYFEYRSSFTIKTGLDILHDIRNNNVELLNLNLQKLAECIDRLGSVLMKMEEMCDPHVFYFRIRPFLAGWKGMADAGLDKNGVIYGNEASPRSYSGGSNAQSSSIQFLDLLLNVKHYPTGERPVPHQQKPLDGADVDNSFMDEMQSYMPGKHQDFLRKIQEVSNVREYVLSNLDKHPELLLSYDACLAMLKAFRDKHIQIVTRYIVLQARSAQKMGSSSTHRSGLAKAKKNGAAEKGTGGTSLLPFLKQCRDETGDPAAGNWGKRILSDGVMRLKYSKSNGINED